MEKSRRIIGGIAIGLALILAGGISGGLLQRHYNWGADNPKVEDSTGGDKENPGESTDKPQDSAGGSEIDTAGGESQNMNLTATKLSSTEYAENGVSAIAESAYTLTATITPANATNQAVDWSVSFVDPTSAWASGKTVTDYVTVTPTSDGALTAVVANVAAFGEQIKITATSRDNPEATAACTVDYQQKFQSLTGYISLDKTSEKKADFSSTANTRLSIDFPIADNAAIGDLGTHTSEISITPIGTNVYTLAMEYEITKIEMKLATNISRGFTEYPAGFTTSHGAISALSGASYQNGKCTGKMQEFMGIADYSTGNVATAKSKLYGYLSGGNDSDRYSDYKVYYTVNGEEKEFLFYLTYNRDSLGIGVNAVTLNNGKLVF